MTLIEHEPAKRKGRPPNAKGVRSRARIADLERAGETPIEIMIDNMTFWHRHAEAMTEKVGLTFDALQDLMSNPLLLEDEDMKEMFKSINKRLMAFMTEMLQARDKSQDCARDAAPYCHPRFLAIQAAPPDPKNITPDQEPLDPLEAARQYQRFISA